MQTPSLPIQVSGASANPAPSRKNEAASGDGAQFSAALSREVAQQQKPAAPAAPATSQKIAQAQARPADKGVLPPKTPVAAKAEAGKPATGNDKIERDAAAAAAAEAAAATTPVVDMLALVASLNLPAQTAPAVAVATQAGAAAATATALAANMLPGADVATKPVADGADSATFELPVATEPDAAPAPVATSLQQATSGAIERLATQGAPVAQPASLTPGSGMGQNKTPATVDGKRVEPDMTIMGIATTRADSADATGATAAQTAPAAALAASDKAAPAKAAPEFTMVKDVQPAGAPASAPLQQAALNVAQTINGASDKIAARVGTPAWDNQVGQKIVWMVAGKEQSASLTLNPPDMGPMQVVLNVTNDHATVTFTAAQPEVRQALEDAMPRLREMMSESGIELGNANVNAGSPDQRQADYQPGGGRFANSGGANGNGANGGNGTGPANDNGSASAAAERNAERGARAGLPRAAVDTFA